MGVASLQAVQSQFAEGVLEARGVREQMLASELNAKEDKVRENLLDQSKAAGLLYQNPPCKFCDFGALCGKSGGGL